MIKKELNTTTKFFGDADDKLTENLGKWRMNNNVISGVQQIT